MHFISVQSADGRALALLANYWLHYVGGAPPVGTTLFVGSGVGKVPISEMIPHVLRFLPAMLVVQLLVTFVPAITTFLPHFLK